MTDNRTTELLPCPFCGGDDIERIGFDALFKERPHIKCHGCGADVYDVPNVSPIWHKHDSMTELWNTRAERTCKPVKEHLDSYSDLTVTVCSNCRVAIDDLEDCYYCPNCGRKVVSA